MRHEERAPPIECFLYVMNIIRLFIYQLLITTFIYIVIF